MKHTPFNPQTHPWATATQAAEYLQVHKVTLSRWIREGKLQATKTTAGYRIPAAALVEFFNQPTEGGSMIYAFTRSEGRRDALSHIQYGVEFSRASVQRFITDPPEDFAAPEYWAGYLEQLRREGAGRASWIDRVMRWWNEKLGEVMP